MSLLADLFHRIFPASHPASEGDRSADPQGAPSGNAAPMASEALAPPVDIEAILTALQATSGQTLHWQTSIVDLMKLVGLDSGLANRRQLAHELHYTGDVEDSATMNVWLHRQVLRKLAANGGRVPGDLLA